MRMDLERGGHFPLCRAAIRLYGSYGAALKASGMDPESIRYRRPKGYTEKERRRLLNAVRRAAKMKPEARDRALRKIRRDYRKQVDTQYGTGCWGKVARDAGVDPKLIRPLPGRSEVPGLCRQENALCLRSGVLAG